MKEPFTIGRGLRSSIFWLAVGTLAAIIGLAVAVSQSGVADTVVAGVGAAAVTGAVSIVLAIVGLQDRQREADERRELQHQAEEKQERFRQEEHVLRALDYFTGHTQRRNVGIAIVEGYWSTTPSLQSALVPLLVNQAIYLLEESGQDDAPHEADNCRRIMNLILRPDSVDPSLVNYYRELREAVNRKSEPKVGGPGRRGVSIDGKTLTDWKTKLDTKLAVRNEGGQSGM
jgi:hypothetical protein